MREGLYLFFILIRVEYYFFLNNLKFFEVYKEVSTVKLMQGNSFSSSFNRDVVTSNLISSCYHTEFRPYIKRISYEFRQV